MAVSPGINEAGNLVESFVEAGMNEIAAQILVAAIGLFAQKGYAATSVREIVKEAQVTNPMLYYYFESKEGVYRRLIAVLFDSLYETTEAVLSEGGPLRSRLRALGQMYFQACRESPETLRFVYAAIFGPSQGRPECDLLTYLQRSHEPVEAVFQRALDHGELRPRPGHDARLLTERFMGLVSNHLMGALAAQELVAPPEIDLWGDEVLDRMLDFFFFGAGDLSQES